MIVKAQVPKSPEPYQADIPSKPRVPKLIKKRDRTQAEVPTGSTPKPEPKAEARVLTRALKADKPMGSVVQSKDDACTLLWADTQVERPEVPKLFTKEQAIAQLWGS